ncbi:hypothetical protein ONS96_001750 [Cadophora gregata f. sp. sojae]|nr:hypothetical protein ONS96_001750 [Cadophora gregata f. sp. sojae]
MYCRYPFIHPAIPSAHRSPLRNSQSQSQFQVEPESPSRLAIRKSAGCITVQTAIVLVLFFFSAMFMRAAKPITRMTPQREMSTMGRVSSIVAMELFFFFFFFFWVGVDVCVSVGIEMKMEMLEFVGIGRWIVQWFCRCIWMVGRRQGEI